MERELLLEIGTEELPASWLPDLTRQIRDGLDSALCARIGLLPDAPVESYSTPRRLTARIAKIAERQTDLDELLTGPPVAAAFGPDGQPTPAAVGFAQKEQHRRRAARAGRDAEGHLSRLSQASARQGRRRCAAGRARDDAALVQLSEGDALGCVSRGRQRASCCSDGRSAGFSICTAAVSCRSRSGAPSWPSRRSVQEVVSAAFTYGHRFLTTSGRAGRAVKVRTFEDYQSRLAEHFVVLDQAGAPGPHRAGARGESPEPRRTRRQRRVACIRRCSKKCRI